MPCKTFVIENYSPYFLHPSKGLGVLITAVIFDEKNYNLWEKVVRAALKSKNKLGNVSLKGRSKEIKFECKEIKRIQASFVNANSN